MFWIVIGVFAIICVMLGYIQSIGEECNSLSLSEGPTIISFQKRFIRICYCAIANGFCGILVTYNAKILDQIYHDITQPDFYQPSFRNNSFHYNSFHWYSFSDKSKYFIRCSCL